MSYPRVCVQYHPDRFRGDSPAEAEAALKRFLEIDAAWRILKDHTSRRQYDLKLRGRSPQTDATERELVFVRLPLAPFHVCTDRSDDTECCWVFSTGPDAGLARRFYRQSGGHELGRR